MIIITGAAELLPDRRGQGIELGCEHSARSRLEPGCVSHNCYVDAENPNLLHFFEQWKDMAAVQAHFAVPESGEFVAKMRQLSVGEPNISIYQAESLEAEL